MVSQNSELLRLGEEQQSSNAWYLYSSLVTARTETDSNFQYMLTLNVTTEATSRFVDTWSCAQCPMRVAGHQILVFIDPPELETSS